MVLGARGSGAVGSNLEYLSEGDWDGKRRRERQSSRIGDKGSNHACMGHRHRYLVARSAENLGGKTFSPSGEIFEGLPSGYSAFHEIVTPAADAFPGKFVPKTALPKTEIEFAEALVYMRLSGEPLGETAAAAGGTGVNEITRTAETLDETPSLGIEPRRKLRLPTPVAESRGHANRCMPDEVKSHDKAMAQRRKPISPSCCTAPRQSPV